MSKVAIVTCDCKDEMQDKLYGKGRRVANMMGKPSSSNIEQFRCTVCTKVHSKNKSTTKPAAIKTAVATTNNDTKAKSKTMKN